MLLEGEGLFMICPKLSSIWLSYGRLDLEQHPSNPRLFPPYPKEP